MTTRAMRNGYVMQEADGLLIGDKAYSAASISKLADENQALRERAETAERLLAESRQHVIFWEAREVAARSEAAAAWNDAIEAAALLVDGNMLCGYGDSNGDEVLLPRSNPGNKLGFGYSRAIRALRRAAPTEDRCAECDCKNGGTECTWIKSGPVAAPTEGEA